MDVLDSPVPALVGVQAPFAPLDQEHMFAFNGVVVLDLDARQSFVSWVGITGEVESRDAGHKVWLVFSLDRTMCTHFSAHTSVEESVFLFRCIAE